MTRGGIITDSEDFEVEKTCCSGGGADFDDTVVGF